VKKIAILALHLGYGGTERAVISEANLLSEFCDVEIYSLYQVLKQPAFTVNDKVKVTYLAKGLKPNKEELREAIRRKNPFKLFWECCKSAYILYLRRSLMIDAVKNCDADIIISSRYMYHKLLTKYAKPGVICIAQEHNHHNNDKKYIKQQVEAVKDMDYFMPVSQELTDFYAARVPSNVTCKYIPHHLEYLPVESAPLTHKNIICVGRLSAEKGLDELLLVFNELIRKYPDWTLHLVGDGEERSNLERLISDLALGDKVVLHGYQSRDNVNRLLLQSSIYLMTSHTESFGLVLIEAQACGLPCVAYASAQGAHEIITNGENGVLIPNRNRELMVETVSRLIEDEDYRRRLGQAGKETAKEYSTERVRDKWSAFINSLSTKE